MLFIAACATGPSQRIDALFHEAHVDAPDGPGCAVAAARAGSTVVARGYGLADVEHGIANTPDTVFYVASVAKQFTALAVELLVHDGALKLDDDVRRYLPDLPVYPTPVRVENLVHQTSGLRDYSVLSEYAGHRYADLTTVADAWALIAGQRELDFTPGERWCYSNSNYFLLARIVEKVAGRPFRDVAADRIFAPLGMTHSRFRVDHASLVPGRAIGYTKSDTGLRLADLNADPVGQGGMYASASDLVRWGQQLGEGRLGGSAVLAAQTTSGRLTSGAETGYADGLFVSERRGVPVYEHSGGVPGYTSDLLYLPRTKLAVAVVCNVAADAPALARQVADVLDGKPAAPPAPPPAATVSAVDLERHAGLYWNRELGLTNRVDFAGGELRVALDADTTRALRPIGADRFRAVGDEGLELRFEAAGLVKQRDGKPPSHWTRVEPPDLSRLQRAAGRFRNEELDVIWRFVVRGDRLVLQRPRQDDVALIPVFRDAFVDEPDGDLFRYDGERWTVTNPRIHELPFARL